MKSDPKILVSNGYDRMAETYLARFGRSIVRDRWLAALAALLPPAGGARVLDLGCGAGLPVAKELTALGHRILGIDGSKRQVALARHNVPAGDFLHGDMTTTELPETSFDAVSAFYSITHVPRSEHGDLLKRIAGWLKPGGVFVGSLGATASSDWQGEWMGTEMYFSHYGSDRNISLVQEAGLTIEHAEEQLQDDEDHRFLWIIARKPISVEPGCSLDGHGALERRSGNPGGRHR
ncbi:class I SAM-dependent methyltransferase [Arenibaculum sp.]|jgi:SAM-dependent methyltransferase|uniref:class I SAM-dependent methyltransferase n=1 Tax=Arenibaculum sp. TaxID=2865862 RepID=UPI002E0D577C|nr:class I SAM-dependent methyltransferase [Arenibaculum sp.]